MPTVKIPAMYRASASGNSDAAPSTQSAALVFDTLGRLEDGIDTDWHPSAVRLRPVRSGGPSTTGTLDNPQNLPSWTPTATLSAIIWILAPPSSRAIRSGFHRKERRGRQHRHRRQPHRLPMCDAAGNLSQITNPNNYSAGLRVRRGQSRHQSFQPTKPRSQRHTDLEGKPRKAADPNGNSTSYTYLTARRGQYSEQSPTR